MLHRVARSLLVPLSVLLRIRDMMRVVAARCGGGGCDLLTQSRRSVVLSSAAHTAPSRALHSHSSAARSQPRPLLCAALLGSLDGGACSAQIWI